VNRILIVEDERRLSRFLVKGLRSNGFAPTAVEDGTSALEQASSDDFDLVLLDLGLPDMDGFDVLEQLREKGEKVPVLILSARDELADKVAGLERGADDYVTKPFKFEELLARIRVRLRSTGAGEETHLESDGVSLDLRTRRATADGRVVDLSAREFTMLETFLRHRGQVLSRDQLLTHVWGYEQDPDTKLVEVYIGYLRRKLGDGVVGTVRGVGYVVR
jgi:two-component system, OmpR family, response regulator QseB